MKKSLVAAALATTLVAPSVMAEVEVILGGHSGNSGVIMSKVLRDVIADDLKEAGIVAKYNAIEGDYNQYLTNSLSAGTAPDLFYIDIFTIAPMSASGKVAPLPASLGSTTADILPNLNDGFTVDGKQYGIAKDFNTLALVYNKDIFDEAGIAYPNKDDNWDTLRDKFINIKKELVDVDGLCITADYARFAAFALGTGWKPFNEDGRTVLDEDFRRAFEFYTSLPDDGAAILPADIGQGWGGGCLATETVAAGFEGAWVGGFLRDKAPSMEYGSTMVPTDPKTGDRGNLIFTVSWSMNADSEQPEAAAKVLELITSEKVQEWVLSQGLALPSRAELVDHDYFKQDTKEAALNRVVFEGASAGNVMPFEFGQYGGNWMEIVNEALSSVLLKQSDVDAALEVAQTKFDKMTGHH